MIPNKETPHESTDMPAYKISAFHDENRESFQPFYQMGQALMNAVLISHAWSDSGMDAVLLRNLIKHVRKVAPGGPFKHKITKDYVDSVLNICNEAEVLADHLAMDQAQIPAKLDTKLDDWALRAQAKVVALCDSNNQMLKEYYLLHDRNKLASDYLGTGSQ